MRDTIDDIELIRLFGDNMDFKVAPCGSNHVVVSAIVGGELFATQEVRIGFGIFLRGKVRRAKRRLKRVYRVCN